MLADRLRLVALLGVTGTLAELVLLQHWEDWQQWSPFVVLGLAALAGVTRQPGSRSWRLAALALVLTGTVGVWLHWRGNAAFEAETDPDLRGWPRITAIATGATPLLAPGALAFIGAVMLLRPTAPGAPGAVPSSADDP